MEHTRTTYITLAAIALLSGCGSERSDTDGVVHLIDGVYLLEEDIVVVGERQLREFADVLSVDKGIVNVFGGEDDIHAPAQAVSLTYCVSTDFGAYYDDVVVDVRAAATEWERAGLVRFIHLQEYDDDCVVTGEPIPFGSQIFVPRFANSAVSFSVSTTDGSVFSGAGGVAPFPHHLRGQYEFLEVIFGWAALNRVQQGVMINYDDIVALSSTSGRTPRGVIRHELGHLLGLRHEHIHPDNPLRPAVQDAGPDAIVESYSAESARVVASYDSLSVMHYPIGGWGGNVGSNYDITSQDRMTLTRLYGPPAAVIVSIL